MTGGARSAASERFGSMSGSLHDPAGARVPNFVIYERERTDARGEVRGVQGSWSLPLLPPGSYQVSSQAGDGSARVTVQLPPGGGLGAQRFRGRGRGT